MSGSANTSEASTPIMTASCPVSLADGATMLAACKQAILLQGGTWPPDGTKTTSGRSASPVTSTTKDDSGFLAKVLTASSPDELRKLCDERNKEESLHRLSSMTLRATTEKSGSDWQPKNDLSKGQATRVKKLRKERIDLFRWFDNYIRDTVTYTVWNNQSIRLQEVNRELLELTGLPQYSK